MQALKKRFLATVATASALAFVAAPASAQECAAELTPPEITSGETAVEVTVALSQPVGAVNAFQAAPQSGVTLAAPEDVPRSDMAAEEEPQPIAMGESETSLTLWLNTSEATPGVYRVAFAGPGGQCQGEVIVN